MRKPTKNELELHRQEVYALRHFQKASFEDIIQHFARKTPPVQLSRWTVQRYLDSYHPIATVNYGRTKIAEEIGGILNAFDYRYRLAMTRYVTATEERDKNAALALANKIATDKLEAMMSLGLVNRQWGTLTLGLGDGGQIEKVPNGVDIAKLITGVVVSPEDITSPEERGIRDAQRALRYGEHSGVGDAERESSLEPADTDAG